MVEVEGVREAAVGEISSVRGANGPDLTFFRARNLPSQIFVKFFVSTSHVYSILEPI